MQQKVALVTGASRGIGAACALALGRAGYKVAVHYRKEADKAREIAQQIPVAMPVQADLADEQASQQLINQVKAELGSVDVLVNNAGMCIDQILPMAKITDFDALISTNLRATFMLSKFASKVMMKQRSGRIINISSVVGFTGNGGQSMYAATKAGIVGFTKSIAVDLASFGILVNCVAPGFIDTDMTAGLPPAARDQILAKIPLKRLGKPDEVAQAVTFLASEGAAYITGTTIHVNGGMYCG